MTAVLQARELGKRYRRRWALSECTLDIPAGRVVGLVGPNGAGKTTLLSLAGGLLTPTDGTIEVCGGRPGAGRAQQAKVGFVAQNTPTYARLTVADHLRLGAKLSPRWDERTAQERIRRLGLSPDQRAGNLSGGQCAQLALTLAVAKRPELLILDEPVAALDPLARRDFMQDLHDATADQELSVVHSSHLVSDVERVCDYVIVLVASRVRLAGDVRALLDRHRLVTAPRTATVPDGLHVVSAQHTDRETTMLVRSDSGTPTWTSHAGTYDPAWRTSPVGLEDLVLAYMSQSVPVPEAHR
ncbi:ABC transporter ATP-binding protein [Spirillospora sp. NPDC052269]